MELHNLRPAKGAVKSGKRIARGQGSGKGGTATRGHKGQKSRSGYSKKRNHEGGQMPLQMRLPKRGFKNPNRSEHVVINLNRLESISEKYRNSNIDIEFLVTNGIVNKGDKVKILGTGELKSNLTITAHAVSASAKESIEKSGGTITIA
jgi:large subunit ribosomal protein L15